MLIRSPVTKNMHKSVRASVVPQKQRLLKSDATLRDAREVLSESQFDTETMCFDEDDNGCMNCIGCSGISINVEE